jgi:hypothetical protein
VSASPQLPPVRLASEDVIVNAPMSYAGSAQRIFRLRRLAHSSGAKLAVTALAIGLVLLAWVVVTAWYLVWGIWLIPYRVLRRGARKRKAEALRHRELMGTIQGSAAASAAAIVMASTTGTVNATLTPVEQPQVRVDAGEREQAATALHAHYVAGRLTHDELDDRVAQAYAARTRGDLASLLADLPTLSAGELAAGSERSSTLCVGGAPRAPAARQSTSGSSGSAGFHRIQPVSRIRCFRYEFSESA